MQELIAAAISTENHIGQPEQAIARMQNWLEKAAEQGVELALFPELNVSGYIPTEVVGQIAEPIPGPSTEKIIQLADRFSMTLAFGILEKDAGSVYCTHVLVNGDGIIGKQRKIHVPFHEQDSWGFGDEIHVFDIGKAKVGITVCRDAFFDEMTRTLYFKGAEIVLMPFCYYNVPRKEYLHISNHGRSLLKSAWTNGFYEVVCNAAGMRPASKYDPHEWKFPGWAGIIGPWGNVIDFVEDEGNDEAMVVSKLDPVVLQERRAHRNFLAEELRPDLYQYE